MYLEKPQRFIIWNEFSTYFSSTSSSTSKGETVLVNRFKNKYLIVDRNDKISKLLLSFVLLPPISITSFLLSPDTSLCSSPDNGYACACLGSCACSCHSGWACWLSRPLSPHVPRWPSPLVPWRPHPSGRACSCPGNHTPVAVPARASTVAPNMPACRHPSHRWSSYFQLYRIPILRETRFSKVSHVKLFENRPIWHKTTSKSYEAGG